ncbi:MAG TPA: O-antigen ligase domain-containing protein [Bacteroidetes bacterium]|nr:O-antigen ligase domain-containing protein [Bacteroidota bacterium]
MLSESKYLNRQNWSMFSLIVMIAGLLFSKFLITLSFVFLLAQAVINPDVISLLKNYLKQPAFMAITAIFFIYIFSVPYSEDLNYALERIRIKLPFLLLPFAFFAIPKMNDKVYFRLVYFFFWLMATICLVLVTIYLYDINYYTELYKKGQIFPTPIQHIRFSLLVCVAISIGVYLLIQSGGDSKSPPDLRLENDLRSPPDLPFLTSNKLEQKIVLALILFMIVFLHVLAVRSGLLALYLLFIFFIIYYILKTKKYLVGGVLFFGIVLFGIIGSQYIPTLKNKISYMRYSVDLFFKNENIRELSDSRRLASIQAGWALGKAHPILGIGVGDIRKETNEYLEKNYPSLANLGLLPHNQYVFYFAVTGLLGLGLFLVLTCFPLFYKKAYLDLFFVSHHIIYFSSFLVEHTLETQIGTTSYLLFLLLGMRHFSERN